jgi:hypothetical protein
MDGEMTSYHGCAELLGLGVHTRGIAIYLNMQIVVLNFSGTAQEV